MDKNDLGGRGIQALMSSARGAVNLREISLNECEVACQGASYISQAFHPAYGDTGERDDLVVEKRQSMLYNANYTAIGAGIADFFLGTALTTLNLRSNGIGPDGAVVLFDKMVRFCSNLQHLDVSRNAFTNDGQDNRAATALSEALKTATSLVTLDLTECRLQAEGGILLVAGLIDKTKQLQREIKELWQRIGQTPDSAYATRQDLERQVEERERNFRHYTMSRALKSLRLARNNFGPAGIQVLGEAKNLHPSLTELDIGSNEVTGNSFNSTYASASCLCKSVKSARHMKSFSLRDNRLGVASADGLNTQPVLEEISSAISKMSAILRLDLAKNMIGECGCEKVSKALDVLRHLMYLDLSSNAVKSVGMKRLAPSFRPSLVEIILADNEIGPDGTTALAVKIPALTNLTRLDLSSNRMTQALDGDSAETLVGGKKKFILSKVANDIIGDGVALGEARKQLLMSGEGGGAKRGLGALAAACAEHLLMLEEIVVHKTIKAGDIRKAQPELNLSGVDFEVQVLHLCKMMPCRGPCLGETMDVSLAVLILLSRYSKRARACVSMCKQDMTIASEILKYNTSVTSVDLSLNDLNQGGQAISEWMKDAHQLQCLNLSDVRYGLLGS